MSVHVQLSLYRLTKAPRFLGGWSSKDFQIIGTESGNIVSPMRQSHLPPGKTPLITMKDLEYLIGNRTLDLTACSAVPQPTALPQAN
jgi:hypothetical protein